MGIKKNIPVKKSKKFYSQTRNLLMFGISLGLPITVIIFASLFSESIENVAESKSSTADTTSKQSINPRKEKPIDKNFQVAEYLQIALTKMEENNWEKVAEACENAIAVDPTISHSYALLGNARIMMHQYEIAVETLRKAATLDPDNVDYLFHLGFALSQSAQDQTNKKKRHLLNTEAIATYDRYLKYAATHNVPAEQISMAHTHLANVYRDIKTSDKQELALENFNKAIEKDENNELAIFNIGLMYAERYGKTNNEEDRERALSLIDKALELNPDNQKYSVIKDTLMGKVAPEELMASMQKMEL